MNRKILAAAALTAAVAFPLTACNSSDTPTAAPAVHNAQAAMSKTPAGKFTDALHAAGFPDTPGFDQAAVESAEANCDLLDSGGTIPMLALLVSQGLDGAATGEQQGVFMYSGISAFCPAYLDDLEGWAAS